MSFIAAEISAQPGIWARAAGLAADQHVLAALPARGERVALVGCGTSLYMAQSCAVLRESAGEGETDAFAASEFPGDRHYDRIVAITRSGTTTEVIRLLAGLAAGQNSTVITTEASHPVVRLAKRSILLDFADERSVVQTRFATAVLALWRAAFAGGLEDAISDAEAALARPLDEQLVVRQQFTFLGTGWTVGLANEAALKLREGAQAWSESYPAMEFRHGPISVVDERSAVWIFGPIPDGLDADIKATGALLVHATIDPMAQLTTAQRLVVAIAEEKGIDPDHPRHLTRSIVLD